MRKTRRATPPVDTQTGEPLDPGHVEVTITHACSTGQCPGCPGHYGDLTCIHHCHYELIDDETKRVDKQEDTNARA